jgi:hypothetical protein
MHFAERPLRLVTAPAPVAKKRRRTWTLKFNALLRAVGGGNDARSLEDAVALRQEIHSATRHGVTVTHHINTAHEARVLEARPRFMRTPDTWPETMQWRARKAAPARATSIHLTPGAPAPSRGAHA